MKIRRGRPLPEIYCKQKEGKKLFLAPDTEKLTIRPFSKEEIRFEVTEANSYLEWEFEVQKRDIAFSLEFRAETNKMLESVELIPKQRIGDSSEPEKACFKCDKAGSCKYNLTFLSHKYCTVRKFFVHSKFVLNSAVKDYH